MARPAVFPAAAQAVPHLPDQVPPDVFNFAASAPDVSDPPASVLADVVPHASVGEFPGDAAFGHPEHLPLHVTDWFV
jgi:hypothetical protein